MKSNSFAQRNRQFCGKRLEPFSQYDQIKRTHTEFNEV